MLANMPLPFKMWTHILGIFKYVCDSPFANEVYLHHLFISYFQPSFLYGTDIVSINKGEVEHLEVSFRSVIKHMLAVPDNTPSCSIYLVAGIFPAEAQRDLDILGLLGQLAVCDGEAQDVKTIIENTLTFYGISFTGLLPTPLETGQVEGILQRDCTEILGKRASPNCRNF